MLGSLQKETLFIQCLTWRCVVATTSFHNSDLIMHILVHSFKTAKMVQQWICTDTVSVQGKLLPMPLRLGKEDYPLPALINGIQQQISTSDTLTWEYVCTE